MPNTTVRSTAAVATAALLALSACSTGWRTLDCSPATGCTITANGEQAIQREFENGVPWVLEIGDPDANRVTIRFQGETATLAPGESAVLAGYVLQVVSIEDDDTVQLRLT